MSTCWLGTWRSEMVSLAEVARVAGVSSATVSRVLSGAAYPVREETRQKVLDAAEQLNFRPNMLARGLVTSRTSIIATIVHDISDPYFGEIVRGVEEAAVEHDYQVLISSSEREAGRELEVLRLLLAYNVDGVVFAGGSLDDSEYESNVAQLIEAFKSEDRAVVHLAPHIGGGASVTVDNEQAAFEMASHLISLGHRRIGLAAGPPHLSTARDRTNGYRLALREAGIRYEPDLVAHTDFTSEGGRVATTELLDRWPDLTAIFAANDLTAFGVLSVLNERGLSVPGEVSVAGFDDVQAAQYVWPSLTTVAVPMRELGRQGFATVLQILEGERPEPTELPTRLVIRDSTAPPPAPAGSDSRG